MRVVPWLIVVFLAAMALVMILLAIILVAIGSRSPPRPLSEIELDYDERPREPAT